MDVLSSRILLRPSDLERSQQFYRDVLGFQEFWRGSRDGKVLDWVNMKAPDGDSYIEFMLYSDLPAPTARGTAHHICLEGFYCEV